MVVCAVIHMEHVNRGGHRFNRGESKRFLALRFITSRAHVGRNLVSTVCYSVVDYAQTMRKSNPYHHGVKPSSRDDIAPTLRLRMNPWFAISPAQQGVCLRVILHLAFRCIPGQTAP